MTSIPAARSSPRLCISNFAERNAINTIAVLCAHENLPVSASSRATGVAGSSPWGSVTSGISAQFSRFSSGTARLRPCLQLVTTVAAFRAPGQSTASRNSTAVHRQGYCCELVPLIWCGNNALVKVARVVRICPICLKC